MPQPIAHQELLNELDRRGVTPPAQDAAYADLGIPDRRAVLAWPDSKVLLLIDDDRREPVGWNVLRFSSRDLQSDPKRAAFTISVCVDEGLKHATEQAARTTQTDGP